LTEFVQFRRSNNIYNLYELYFSEFVYQNDNLQSILQQFYINPYLITTIQQHLGYHRNMTQRLSIHGDVEIPPQIREVNLINYSRRSL
jgi:hypothetical protein